MSSPLPATSLPCLVCGDPTEVATGLACAVCGSPHHTDCWSFAGGCSRFGCGGDRSLPLAQVQDREGSRELVIDESSIAPSLRPSLGLALWRKLKGPARALPYTVGMGLVGSLVATGLMIYTRGLRHADIMPVLALGLSGMLHGLLAPYLAPTQHRSPWRMAFAGFLVFLVSFQLIDGPLRHWSDAGKSVLLVLTVVGSTVSATSVAEGLLGPRSWAGQRLGRLSLPLRLAATWLAGLALWIFMVTVDVGTRGIYRELWMCAQLALLSALPGFPALERGKAEFRGWRPALPSSPEVGDEE